MNAGIGIVALAMLLILGVLVLVLIIRKPLSGLVVLFLLVLAFGGLMTMNVRTAARRQPPTVQVNGQRVDVTWPGVSDAPVPTGQVHVGPDGVRVSLPGLPIPAVSVGAPAPDAAARAAATDDECGYRVAEVFPSEWGRDEVLLRFRLEELLPGLSATSQASGQVEAAIREYGSELFARHLEQVAHSNQTAALAGIRSYLKNVPVEAQRLIAQRLVAESQAGGRVDVSVVSGGADGDTDAGLRDVIFRIPRRDLTLFLSEVQASALGGTNLGRLLAVPAAFAIVLVAYLILKTHTRRSRASQG